MPSKRLSKYLAHAELLHKILGEAFDEGAEAPYDLREGVIDGLLKKIMEESRKEASDVPTGSTYRTLVNGLVGQIPPAATKILKSTSCVWLSGGQIVRMLRGRAENCWDWKKADWDFFCSSKCLKNLHIYSSLEKVTKGPYNQPKQLGDQIDEVFKTWIIGASGIPVRANVISGKFDTPEDVVKGFDFQFLRSAFYYTKTGSASLYMAPGTWTGLRNGIIELNRESSTNDPKNRMKRIIKYVGRGFRDVTGIVETGVLPAITRGR